MDDNDIIELFWKRDDAAISESVNKYYRYCRKIAYLSINTTVSTWVETDFRNYIAQNTAPQPPSQRCICFHTYYLLLLIFPAVLQSHNVPSKETYRQAGLP